MDKNDKLMARLFAALDVAPKTSAEMQAWAATKTHDASWISTPLGILAEIHNSQGPGSMAEALALVLEEGYPVDWIVLLTRIPDSGKLLGEAVLPYAIAGFHRDLSLVLAACDVPRKFCDGRMLAQLAQWLREAGDGIMNLKFPASELAKQIFREAQIQRQKDMADEVDRLNLVERTFLGFASESMEKDDLEGFEDAVKSLSPDYLVTTFGLLYYGILEKKRSGTLKRPGEYMSSLARAYPDEMKRYLGGIVQVLKVPGEPDTGALVMMKWMLDSGVIDEAFAQDSLGAFELKTHFSDAYDKYLVNHDDPEFLLEGD